MGTKVLNIPPKEDLQTFKRLLSLKGYGFKDVLSSLINHQQRWIDNEGAQGISRSKDFYFLWKSWVSSGLKPEVIPPINQRHSLAGKLQDAMRLICSCNDNKKVLAMINIISTALRYHELYGPTDLSKKKITKDQLKVISDVFDVRPTRLAFWSDLPADVVCKNDTDLDQFKTAKILRKFLEFGIPDLVRMSKAHPTWKLPSRQQIRVKVDEAELLVKKSPHSIKKDGKIFRLASIIAEPLDEYAFQGDLSNGRTSFTDHNGQMRIGVDDSCKDKSTLDLLQELAEIMISKSNHSDLIVARRKIIEPLPDHYEVNQGEIVFIDDKAGKARGIAMSCYTVNAFLEPLHQWMFSLLETIPCDSTDQAYGLRRCAEFTEKKTRAKSTDLTSASDRFPRFIQRLVLTNLLTHFSDLSASQAKRVAYLWDTSLGRLKFKSPEGIITYGTGTPMGVKTSWPMLSLTNHVYSMAAAYEYYTTGLIDRKTYIWYIRWGYLVCGDDKVDTIIAIANLYSSMINSTNVPTNDLKSFETFDETSSRIEFCKRLFVNGFLVSGKSPKSLYKASKFDITSIPLAVRDLEDLRGSVLKFSSISEIASRYPRSLHHIPKEYGGLGSVSHVPRIAIVSQYGFLVLYYYIRLKSLQSSWKQSDFTVSEPDYNLATDQIGLLDDVQSFYPENEYRKRSELWQHLMDRDKFSGPAELVDKVDYLVYTYSSLINLDPKTLEMLDFDYFELADLTKLVLRNVKQNLFHSSVTENEFSRGEDRLSSKVALRVNKHIQKSLRSSTVKNSIITQWDSVKGIFVPFIEYLDTL